MDVIDFIKIYPEALSINYEIWKILKIDAFHYLVFVIQDGQKNHAFVFNSQLRAYT